MEEELWIDMKGLEENIQVSSLGRFKNKITGHIYNLGKYSNGYLQFSFSLNKKRYTGISHRIVAKHFIPNPENKCCVNHKNGIKTDNRVENLEWVTYSENIIHSFKVLKRPIADNQGEKNPRSILVEKQVLEIRQLYEAGFTQTELAKKFKMNLPAIYKIIKRINWKHI